MLSAFRQFMKKLRAKKTPKLPTEYKRFLTYMYYFATGEGHICEIRFCYADSKKEAIEKHLDCFKYSDSASRTYFSAGISVCEFDSEIAKKIFKNTFQAGLQMHKILMEAGQDMQFKLQYNYA